VLRIIDECHEEAKRLLTEHRRELEALARALLERKTLDEEGILEVTGLPPATGEQEGTGSGRRLPRVGPTYRSSG
jgi:cell division protease FtsH